jgi:hypothetical protein
MPPFPLRRRDEPELGDAGDAGLSMDREIVEHGVATHRPADDDNALALLGLKDSRRRHAS